MRDNDGLVNIETKPDKSGNNREFIVIDEKLSSPFVRAVEKYQMGRDDNSLKDEALNLLFRVQDRLARYHDKPSSLEAVLNMLEFSSIQEHLGYMKKYIR